MRYSILIAVLAVWGISIVPFPAYAAGPDLSGQSSTEKTLVHRSKSIFSTSEIVIEYDADGIHRVVKNGREIDPGDHDEYVKYIEKYEFNLTIQRLGSDLAGIDPTLLALDPALALLESDGNATIEKLEQMAEQLTELKDDLPDGGSRQHETLDHLLLAVDKHLFRRYLFRLLVSDGLVENPGAEEIDIEFKKDGVYFNGKRLPDEMAEGYRHLIVSYDRDSIRRIRITP